MTGETDAFEDGALSPEETTERERLELEKLRREVRGFERPTWWEVLKTLLTVAAIVGPLTFGLHQFGEDRYDRAVDLLYDKPSQGVALLRQHGDRGLEAIACAVMGDALLGDGETGGSGDRRLSRFLLRSLRDMDADELDPVRTKLRRHFEEVELGRRTERLTAKSRFEKDGLEGSEPLPPDLVDLVQSLCAQAEVNDLFAEILASDDASEAARKEWNTMKKRHPVFGDHCP